MSARQLLASFPTSDPSNLDTHAAAYAREPSACTSCPCVFGSLLSQDWRHCGRLRLLCHPVQPRRVLGSRDSASQRPTKTVMLERSLFRASPGKPVYNHRWRAAAAVSLGVPASCPLVGFRPGPAPVWRSSRLCRFVRVPLDIPFCPLTSLSCVVFVFVSGFLAPRRSSQGESNLGYWGGSGRCRTRLAAPRRRAVRPACGAGRVCASRRRWRGPLYPAAEGVPLLASFLVLGDPARHLPHAARRREDHDPGCLGPAPCRRVPSAVLLRP